MNKPLKVFITYARKDKEAKNKLITSLAVMKRQGLIEIWHDNEMYGGDRWQNEIFSKHLPSSDLLLYLVSADSLASENCYKEFKIAREKKIRVIPIIFSDCDWKNDQLSNFQVFPDDGTPINEWDPEDKGWQNAVKGIRKTVENMLSQSESASDVSKKEREAETVFQHGNFLLKLGKIDLAIAAYSEAIALNPSANAYIGRGVAYANKGEFDCAIEEYDTAICLKPDSPIAYYNRGNAYLHKNEPDQALKDYTQAIKWQPDDADAYTGRGVAYYKKGEFDLAINDYSKAIKLNSDYIIAYGNRGKAYRDKGDIDNAIADYTKAIELDPDNAILYNDRGVIYGKKDEYDLAIKDFTKAIRLTSGNFNAYYNLGRAYDEKGEYNQAIENYDRVIELNPNYISAYYRRGVAWLYLQEWERAKSDLTTTRDRGRGIDITIVFRNDFGSLENFEQINGVQLPEDIAALLTPPRL